MSAGHEATIVELKKFITTHGGLCGGLEYAVMWLSRNDVEAAKHYLNRVDPDKVLYYPIEVRQYLRQQGLWTFPDPAL